MITYGRWLVFVPRRRGNFANRDLFLFFSLAPISLFLLFPSIFINVSFRLIFQTLSYPTFNTRDITNLRNKQKREYISIHKKKKIHTYLLPLSFPISIFIYYFIIFHFCVEAPSSRVWERPQHPPLPQYISSLIVTSTDFSRVLFHITHKPTPF